MITPEPAGQKISGILRYPNESKNVEFKPPFPWPENSQELYDEHKAHEVIKTILGMSNVEDAGKIILGVEEQEEGLVLEGMSQQDLRTYDKDDIFQQIRNFGEPEPAFEVHNIEYEDKNFIVFTVESFDLTPVISKNPRSLHKLGRAELYIRTDKPETKKVKKPKEMREVVNLAVEKELKKFSGRIKEIIKDSDSGMDNLSSAQEDPEEFEEEISDLR